MKKLNLMTPINPLGYGVAGLNILKALHKSVDVCLFPIGQPDISTPQDGEIFQETLEKRVSSDPHSPCVKIWHEFSMYERVGTGDLFAFPFFEITKFDDNRKNSLKYANNVIVSSEWAADIIRDQVPSLPVYVAPLGVDRSIFNENAGSEARKIQEAHEIKTLCFEGRRSNKLRFFNCGKWEVRKGHDILLSMFQAAFPSENDVELSMMTHNPFLNDVESREWNVYYSSDPRVNLIERKNTPAEVAEEMGKADCGIFPSRSEGWNLELLEMMSCGKPVIATNYSAHTEYCDEENCMLIDIDSFETAFDDKWFKGTVGDWASLQGNAFDQAVSHMRTVYSDWKEGKDLENKAGIETAKAFSWEATAESVKEAVFS